MIQKIILELRRIENIKSPLLRLNELEKLDHTYTKLLNEEKKVTIRKLEQESKKK
jgi:hypothetical protein|tara:strand:+ start:75 stop:239 length:165 start_codon:yes stop_codon:yes gene_type:complete